MCTHVFGGTYSQNGQYGLNLGSSALDLVSPPIFANNGVGNIFPDTPVVCSSVISNNGGTPGTSGDPAPTGDPVPNNTPEMNSTAGSASHLVTNASYAVSGNASLNSFLANTRTGNSSLHGIFIGQYAYVDSLDGLQIIALDSAPQNLAMSGTIQ
jgi:hypothetical protein